MITLTFVPSSEQLIAGIPRTVGITVSQPATIYYTLDGSLPTPFSFVYSSPIVMPTDVGTITLSAIAYYFDGYSLVPSPVLSQTFFTDQTDLDRSKLLFFEGVVYIYPGGPNIPYYYDSSGNVAIAIDIQPEELLNNELVSDRDVSGAQLPLSEVPGDAKNAPVEQTPTLFDDNPVGFSTPNGSATFNPDALLIIVDGRDGAKPQSPMIINSPFMSLRDPRKDYGGISYFDTLGTNYVSGSGIRPLINREKGIIVFNYFDSNTSRWIKSIQKLAPQPQTEITPPSFDGPVLIFKWFNFGRHQANT